jgi:hypothetical protein
MGHAEPPSLSYIRNRRAEVRVSLNSLCVAIAGDWIRSAIPPASGRVLSCRDLLHT